VNLGAFVARRKKFTTKSKDFTIKELKNIKIENYLKIEKKSSWVECGY